VGVDPVGGQGGVPTGSAGEPGMAGSGPGPDCTPSIANYTSGHCGDTVLYLGALYECINDAPSCGPEAGLYCGTVAPDAAYWGPKAWAVVPGCE
jgi:hypothetical protein